LLAVGHPNGGGIGRLFFLRQRLFQRGTYHGGFGDMAASARRLQRRIERVGDLEREGSHDGVGEGINHTNDAWRFIPAPPRSSGESGHGASFRCIEADR